MLTYPQLSQFPLRKSYRTRTVVNQAADGSSVKLPDPAGGIIQWTLQYANLSDAELQSLQQFFTAAEGQLNSFTFLDPTANLLAWSDDLANAVWTKAPFLNIAPGHISNSGQGPQSISQTLQVPGGYQYCVSVYVRSAAPVNVTLLLGTQRATRAVGPEFSRISLSGTADSGLFGLELPAGAAIDLYGFQVEAQAAPSACKTSTTGGVYEGARFRDDTFAFTTTDVNRHSATVNIIYASHL